MEPAASGMAASGGAGVVAPAARRCPLCGQMVAPDGLGLYECVCGWGGPGDPLEGSRGVARSMQLWERHIANEQALRDLRRLRASGARIESASVGYAIVLFVASTIIYLLLYGALAASLYFGVRFLLESAWIGLGLCAILVMALVFMLFPRQPRRKGISGPRAQFPRLAAALDEVSQRLGAPVPHRVIVTPGAEAYVFSHRPLSRLFRRELVLGVGAGALPLLSEVDLKALLAHELAHFRHGDTLLHRYYGGAEVALERLVYLMSNSGTARGGVPMTSLSLRSAELAIELLTLPIRIIWIPFHFLRLRESRMAEFAADRVAAETYGAISFVNGLTGLRMADNTLRGAGRSLVAEMRKHGVQSLYAELRGHYGALSPEIISHLRVKAAQDFRSLERTHPTTSDRLRAVYGLGTAPLNEPFRPAFEMLVPANALNTDALEAQLTKLWLNAK